MTSILLVDDDRTLRAVIAEGLTSEGYVVSEAGNGKEALGHLATNSADIILTDLAMPGMDGIELITQLHKTYARRFHIIAMTAGLKSPKADTSDFVLLRAADALGAERTLEKPFRMKALLDLLRTVTAL